MGACCKSFVAEAATVICIFLGQIIFVAWLLSDRIDNEVCREVEMTAANVQSDLCDTRYRSFILGDLQNHSSVHGKVTSCTVESNVDLRLRNLVDLQADIACPRVRQGYIIHHIHEMWYKSRVFEFQTYWAPSDKELTEDDVGAQRSRLPVLLTCLNEFSGDQLMPYDGCNFNNAGSGNSDLTAHVGKVHYFANRLAADYAYISSWCAMNETKPSKFNCATDKGDDPYTSVVRWMDCTKDSEPLKNMVRYHSAAYDALAGGLQDYIDDQYPVKCQKCTVDRTTNFYESWGFAGGIVAAFELPVVVLFFFLLGKHKEKQAAEAHHHHRSAKSPRSPRSPRPKA